MPKLFFTLILISLTIVFIIVVFRLFLGFLKPKMTDLSQQNVDQLVEELEFKISRIEREAEKGIEDSQNTLNDLKDQLKKARKIQSKLK
jgi:transcriptional regulator